MPIITFHELVKNPRRPMRATKNAGGYLPDRHHRCEPVRLASGLGWYVFPPFDFQVVFDGVEAIFSLDDGDWYPLTAIQYPDFAASFDAAAPLETKGLSPPFLAMTEDHAILQIFSGYVVRTAPGWSVLVRAPLNIIAGQGYQHFEGLIETDQWFGPLFTNVKLLRTDAPIHFSASQPLLQVMPVRRENYDDALLNDFEVVEGFAGFDWDAFRQVHVKDQSYAAASRKRRATEKGDSK